VLGFKQAVLMSSTNPLQPEHPVNNTTVTRLAAVVVASLAGLSTASAGPTVVRNAPAGELGAAGIFSHVYGGAFSAAGDGYTNGTVTATRVGDDSLELLSSLSTGGDAGDSVWSDGKFEARTIAKFSLNTQSFGTFGGDSGGSFESLFDAAGFGTDVTGAGVIDLSGETWRWGRTGSSGTHSSLASDNFDGRDHLVTYRIDGLDADGPVWALFWEDLDKTATVGKYRSYADYNDFVIELRGITPDVTAVPLPPALLPALAVLGGMGYVRNRRRGATA
jgi:hypothetical protein